MLNERLLITLYLRRTLKYLALALLFLSLIFYSVDVGFVNNVSVTDVNNPDIPVDVSENGDNTSNNNEESEGNSEEYIRPLSPILREEENTDENPLYSPQEEVDERDTPSEEEPIPITPQITNKYVPRLDTVFIALIAITGLFMTIFLMILLWIRTPKEIRILLERNSTDNVKHHLNTSIINTNGEKIHVEYKAHEKGRWGIFKFQYSVPPFLDYKKIKEITSALGLNFDYHFIKTETTLEEFIPRYQLLHVAIQRIIEIENKKSLKQFV